MNSTQIEKLVLSDRRPVKEHVDDLSRDLSDHVIITKAASRKITEKTFVGTFVNEPGKSLAYHHGGQVYVIKHRQMYL